MNKKIMIYPFLMLFLVVFTLASVSYMAPADGWTNDGGFCWEVSQYEQISSQDNFFLSYSSCLADDKLADLGEYCEVDSDCLSGECVYGWHPDKYIPSWYCAIAQGNDFDFVELSLTCYDFLESNSVDPFDRGYSMTIDSYGQENKVYDSCESKSVLIEVSCDSHKKIKSQKITCPDGYECDRGACKEIYQSISEKAVNEVKDSIKDGIKDTTNTMKLLFWIIAGAILTSILIFTGFMSLFISWIKRLI